LNGEIGGVHEELPLIVEVSQDSTRFQDRDPHPS